MVQFSNSNDSLASISPRQRPLYPYLGHARCVIIMTEQNETVLNTNQTIDERYPQTTYIAEKTDLAFNRDVLFFTSLVISSLKL